jgi:hypothetical protein
MGESTILAGLVLVSTAIIGALIYIALRRPESVIVYNEPALGPHFQTHGWGYGYKPWWRRYNGIPGLTPSVKPVVKPAIIPNPPKPIIISKV